MNLDLFQRSSLSEVAARLEVHPFDIARFYGQKPEGLPKELSFSAQDITTIASELKIEFWWSEKERKGKEASSAELVQMLADKLVSAKLEESVRGDNLYRGLRGTEFQLIRRIVNILIKLEVLQSSSGAFGIMVCKGKNFSTVLREISREGKFPDAITEVIH